MKTQAESSRMRLHGGAVCCTILLTQLSSAVMADLRAVPGLNGVQTATADAVQTICPQMATLNGSGELSSTQQALFFRCRELVQTSNELQRSGASEFSLGLSEEGLAEALQRVAPEETEIMGAGVTDTSHDQLTNLASRMQALRTGLAINSTSGLAWNFESGSGGAAGDEHYSRLGVFINGIYGTGDRDGSAEENGFDYDAYGLTAGLDYALSDALILGLALGYSQSEADIENRSGSFDTDGNSLSLYATYQLEKIYLEASLTYGLYDYEGDRNIVYGGTPDAAAVSQSVSGDTEGDQFAYSLALGFNEAIDRLGLHVFGRVQGIDADIDAYDESGSELAMRVADQSVESLQLIAGGQLSYTIDQSYGALLPYIGVAFHFETEDDARDVTAQYLFDPTNTAFTFSTEEGDSSFSILSLGASVVLAQGRQLFINVDTVLGMEDVTSNTVTAGARFEL
ncbi:autotransporter outer membrane beta-barrel domain-containing protein [Allohahella marinimesophila]|uniref:Autotransporter domain-containing protein n=1 Tax=Allohahella marinimesophila TaxID=1054972 RepID=A0ABP7PHI0_9GAMM